MQKSAIQWNMKQIKKMMDNGTLKFTNPVQRGYVWDKARASLLIDTILRDYICPPIYTIKEKTDNGVIYDGLDGKQRSTTVKEFLSDEFSLGNLEQFELESEPDNPIDISGMKFSELPEEMQDKILTYTFTVYMIDDASEDEMEEIMSRMNNGKAMSSYEHSRIKAKDLATISEIANHPLIAGKTKRYENEQIVVQSQIMLQENEPCLDAKPVKEFMENVEFTEDDKNALKEIYNFITEARVHISKKADRKLMNRTNLVSVVPIVVEAFNKEWSERDFGTFLDEFFSNPPQRYKDACVQGSTHTQNVKIRNEELMKAFNS